MRWTLALALAACSARKLGPPIEPGRNVGATHAATSDAGAAGPLLVATLGEHALGPFLAMGDAGGLVAYFAVDGQTRKLVTLPLDAAGVPSGDARAAATAPVDSAALVVRSVGAAYVTGWTALTEKGEAVFVQGIGAKGAPLAAPVELTRTANDVVWIAIEPSASGAVVFWAEETARGDADVLAVALDAAAKPRGLPSHVARGVTGWQAVPARGGAGLAVLRPADKESELAWIRVDADAHATGPAVVVAPRAGKDMDVARAGDGYAFAWTDRSRGEPAVVVVVTDDAGKEPKTRAVTLGRGAGALTQLAGGPGGAMVAWEEPSPQKGERRVHLDVVAAKDAALTIGAAVPLQSGAQPELVPSRDGFALLGWTRLCAKAAPDACASAPFAPAALALDPSGAVTHADALPAAPGQTTRFAWGLACGARGCHALEATSEGQTRVFVAPVLARPSGLAVAQRPPPPADAPEILALDTVVAGAAVVDASAARIGKDGPTLVSTLTANDDGATSTLAVRVDGAAPLVVTKRALAVGGAATAAADDGAAVAWVARDAGDPQVHVARFDRAGKRAGEVQLTTAKGDAGDVAVGAAAGGWLVSWVDARDGNGEVYAARLGKELQRVGREERVTSAPGDATDLTMLVVGDRAWLAWADPRESAKDGFADVWTAAVDTKDAKPAVPEARVVPTAAHSRSPSLCAADGVIALGWIEDAPPGADSRTSRSYGAMIAAIDPARGQRSGDAMLLPTADDGFATGVWLDPRSGARPRGILVRASATALALDTFEAALGAHAIAKAWPLLVLDGPPTLDVPVAFADATVYFGDSGPAVEDRRLRRATLRWKR